MLFFLFIIYYNKKGYFNMENNKKNKFNLKNLKKNTCNSLFEIEYFSLVLSYKFNEKVYNNQKFLRKTGVTFFFRIAVGVR